MAIDKVFQFQNPQGGISAVDANAIEAMSIPQFAQFQDRLVRVRRDRRHDTLLIATDTMVAAGTKKSLFRKGIGEDDNFFGSNTEFTKSLLHTNMLRNGEFEQGDLVIIKNIEVEQPSFGGLATTEANGAVTNAKATFPAAYDPALAVYTWLNQLAVRFKRGNTVIFETLAINLSQDAGIYAAFGANSGAYVQNGNGTNLMPNVQVLAGGEDFSVEVEALANFDLTAATGLNRPWKTKLVLETIELRRIYA
jgi:hypothetical protein